MMEVDSTASAPGGGASAVLPPSSSSSAARVQKSHTLATHTIRSPPFAYAHLELVTSSSSTSSSLSSSAAVSLDPIQVRTYLTSALRQFLGISGQAIAVDVLRVDGARCWLRVPRDDLSAFAAAVTAWPGTAHEGSGGAQPQHATFRIRGCSDWLGGLIGQDGMEQVWKG